MSYKIDEVLELLYNISERLERIEDALDIDIDFDEDELEETLSKLDKNSREIS